MPWSKLDDSFYDHEKVVAAGTLGAGLFALALSYTARKLTDGFVPRGMIPRLVADVDDPIALADRLVEAGLFEKVEGGYQIHDYLDYNPSAAEIKQKREASRRRQRQCRGQPETPPEPEAESGAEGPSVSQPGPETSMPGEDSATSITDAATGTVTDGVTDTVTNGVTHPVTDGVTHSVTDDVTDSVTGSVTHPVTNTTTRTRTRTRSPAALREESEKSGVSGGSLAPAPCAGERPPKKSVPGGDPRTKSQQIQLARAVGGGRYPPKELYDDIIALLGANPAKDRLLECRKAWLERGYNPSSWEWLTDWYRHGIPPRPGSAGNGPRASPGGGAASGLSGPAGPWKRWG